MLMLTSLDLPSTLRAAYRLSFYRLHQFALPFVGVLLPLTILSNADAQEKTIIEERLQQWLVKYPKADTNGDGVLTQSEAKAFRKTAKQSESQSPQQPARTKSSPPTFGDVPYGPHPRNSLDLWQASSSRPTPVLIFFHGGSFKAGDKSMIQSRPALEECLAAGISVVSANYRFSSDAPFPAPMLDGARVVQFIRSKATEWNLDPNRIALSGSSAGATLALWVTLHADLAEPSSTDPIARFSTRVTCASPHSGTAGLEPEYFQEHVGMTKLGAALWQLFGAKSQSEFESATIRPLLREASPLHHASQDDPPLFLTYAGDPSEAPFTSDSSPKGWIHHVALGLPLQARYEAMGVECELYHHAKSAKPDAEITFLKRHLLNPMIGVGELGKLVFHDQFERVESQEQTDEPGNGWGTNSKSRAKGNKQVDLRNGAMYIYTHAEADHAASVTHPAEFTDGSVTMRFMLEHEDDSLGLNFADLECKEVHAGHLFAARISPKQTLLQDLKTGNMRLDIREARQAKQALTVDQQQAINGKEKVFSQPIEIGKWYDLLVTVSGDQLSVAIDGKPVGSFRSPGIAHPTKRLLRLAVPRHAVVDDIKIWQKK